MDVKRGNLHPEQHQIGVRPVFPERMSRPMHAGRWLEPTGNGGPRGMVAIKNPKGLFVTESGLQVHFVSLLCMAEGLGADHLKFHS